jgi:hypothetical protein
MTARPAPRLAPKPRPNGVVLVVDDDALVVTDPFVDRVGKWGRPATDLFGTRDVIAAFGGA